MNKKINDISTKKTTLEWDKYIDYLIEAVDESNFMKRSENKPMQTTKHNLEAHITSRATHVRAAADIAKRIAQNLGLNYKYIYAAMLMHDAGHPFSAHDGEEIFIGIGEEYNVDYYHHNAKGVEVVISEDICGKAINKIPNIENRPELRKKLEEEFYYFLDVIISHDGEAGMNELGNIPKEYPNMKAAVYEKLKSSNSTNNYKFIAQTIEGRIAKYADVIAYLSTDIQDRFRLGKQKGFDEDYLEFMGEILAKDFVETRESKIEIAKGIIEEIKEDKLMQLVKDARALENRKIIEESNKIVDKIHKSVEDYDNKSYEIQEELAEKVIENYLKNYKENHGINKMSNEEKKFLNADVEKIREFTRNKLRMRTSVIEAVTNKIRETLINDLLKESKMQGEIGFSGGMKKLFFKAKELNYRYVPETKWDYQKEDLPVATYKLVHMLALALRKSGAIQNKFYDKTMRKHIKDKEALNHLKTIGYTDDDEYEKCKKIYGIKNIRNENCKFTAEGGTRDKATARRELCNSVYHYVLDSEELFATMYENTYNAVENQVISKIKNSIGKLPKNQGKSRKTNIDFFDKKILKQEEYFRKELNKKYGNLKNITEEQILEFAKPIIEKERRKMEGKMAVQMAVNYISGMTDNAIFTHAIEIGVLDEKKMNSSSRGNNEDDLNEKYNTEEETR